LHKDGDLCIDVCKNEKKNKCLGVLS